MTNPEYQLRSDLFEQVSIPCESLKAAHTIFFKQIYYDLHDYLINQLSVGHWRDISSLPADDPTTLSDYATKHIDEYYEYLVSQGDIVAEMITPLSPDTALASLDNSCYNNPTSLR